MEVLVSAIVCIGVCMGLACGCTMRCSARSKWDRHYMSKAQWQNYFNEGGEI